MREGIRLLQHKTAGFEFKKGGSAVCADPPSAVSLARRDVSRGTLVYAAQRLVLITFTAIVVSSIVFIGIHQLPGNAIARERRINPATEAALLHHYHLDLPWPQQYALWLQGLSHCDLGQSVVNEGTQITPLLLPEAKTRVTLALAAVAVTVIMGMSLRVLARLSQHTWVDYVASPAAVVGYSVPTFVW